MSKTVEDRVVKMQFDNQRFERNVRTTMGTLDKLKQSLRFDGAAKGFEEIGKAANSVKLSGLSSAIETARNRFSALEVMAITSLANITNSVVNAGKKLVDSFTVEPIRQGFAEYELKMGAVQTIMASTGSDIKTVNGYLDELNTYADKTIYSFSDMTQSIGKFTNAGVSLEDAVKAIQGISNEAAVSGANANEASHAMYNFAQALSSGAVKLIDWKSIELANMGTLEFKQSLLDTALAMGTVVKVGNQYQTTTTDLNGNISRLFDATYAFNDSLSAQWMTTDVLVQTLGNYATDVREMTNAEKKAYEEKLRGIGYTEEQIKAIEELGQKAFNSAQDVKTFSQLLDTLKEAEGSGWSQTFEILFGNLEESKTLWTSASTVIGSFMDHSSKARNDLLQGWKELGGRQDVIDSIRNAFDGLRGAIQPVTEASREIFPPVTSKQLANLSKGLKEFTAHLKLSDEDAENLKNTSKGLFAVLDILRQGISSGVKAASPMLKAAGSLVSEFLHITGAIGKWTVSLDQAVKEHNIFNGSVEKVYGTLAPVLSSAREHILGFGKSLEEFAQNHSRIKSFDGMGEIAAFAMKKLTGAFQAAAPVLSGFGEAIIDTLEKVHAGMAKAVHGEGFDSLIDLLNGGLMVGIGAGIMKFIKNLTSLESVADDTLGGFSKIVNGAKNVIGGVKDTLADFQASLKAGILMKIAGAIAVLTGSLLVLSLIDSDKLGGALASISILFGELAGVMLLFDKTLAGQKNMVKTGTVMAEMSVGVFILAGALKKLAGIDSVKLTGSLIGITVLIGEMAAVSIVLSKWGGKIQTSAVSMILFAEALRVLTKAVTALSTLDTGQLIKGLTGVGTLMAEMAAFMAAAKFGSFKATQGLAMIELAGALLILEKAVLSFGTLDTSVMNKGLFGVAAALTAIVAAMRFMPQNMAGIGLGLVEVAAALKIISGVMQSAGGMSWESIGKGILVLASSMGILAVSLQAMKGTLGASSSILIMSSALAIFVPTLKSLGSMSLQEIGKGILALASAFTVFGIAGAVLGPMVPSILGLSAAMALFGAAVAACGVGVLAFSAGLASLAVSGVAGITALVAGLDILIVGILNTIANSHEAIASAVKAVLLATVDVIVSCAPAIAEGTLTLIEEILKSLAVHTPNIVAYLMDFLIRVLDTVADRLPELIQSAVHLVGVFFQGIIDALKGIDTSTLAKGIIGIGLLSAVMIALGAVVGFIPSAMAGVLGIGAVIAELALVLAAVGAFAQLPGLKWLIGEGGNLLQEIGAAIGKFAGGIVAGLMGGISSQFPQIGRDLSLFMNNVSPFIEGAGKIDTDSMNGVKALAETILVLTAANVLNGLTKWFSGGVSLTKFGEELAEFGPYFKAYSDSISGIDGAKVEASANAAKTLAEFAKEIPNQGGVAGWFMGENNLAKFAKDLAEFGPYLKAYADSVQGLSPNIVVNSANAAKALSELANNLPNTGGLISWFTGDNDIGTFGRSMEEFGKSLSAYYQSIATVETAKFSETAVELRKLVDIANGISEINSYGMSGFAQNLASLGKSGIDEFIRAFVNAETKVSDAASSMIASFIKGAKSKQDEVSHFLIEMLTKALTALKSLHGDFEAEGKTLAEKIAAGIKSGEGNISFSAVHSGQTAVDSLREKYNDFYMAGAYLVDGFVKGISDNVAKAAVQAMAMAQEATTAARTQLDIHSPSKVFAEIGGYVVEGFAEGIIKHKAKAVKAAQNLADVGIKAAKEVAESLRKSDSIFSEFVEKTDENGNVVEITLEKAAEAFQSFRNSVKESIASTTDVFDAFEVETDITGKKLLENLRSQIAGVAKWASNIQLLADRGVNQGLLKVLSDMGPSGAKYVNALVVMSSKELKELNALYEQRLRLNDKAADKVAASFLDGGKKAAKAYVKGLTASTKEVMVDAKYESESATRGMMDGSVSVVTEMADKLTTILSWTYKDAVKEMKSSLTYGKGAFQQLVNEYLTSTQNITLGNKAINAASKAITAYGKQLYKESDYYEEDTANLKAHKAELASLQTERTKLQKQLKKAQKSNTAASKKQVKTLKQQLAANKETINAAKEQIKSDETEIAEHTKEVYNNLRSSLSDSISAFLNPLKVSLETGIDLFKKFESNTSLYETDKKNLEEHQKSLKELEETQKEIQNEIGRYASQNTLAARQRVKELKSQLSEVENSIEEAKKNIEQAENDMASHSQVTVDSILENMQSQVTGVKKWQENIQMLASRGLSQGLIEKLKGMGTDGADYVDQFIKMTSEEIQKANNLFAQSENLTSQTLIQNFSDSLDSAKAWADGLQKMAKMGFDQNLLEKLGDMGVDGYDYVQAFLAMTPDQITQFNQEFADSLKLPDTIADQVISSYAYTGGQSIAGFTSALKQLSQEGTDENKALIATATEIGKVLEKTLKKISKSTGKNAVSSLSQGIKDNKKTVTDTSTSLGNAVLKSLKNVLSKDASNKIAVNITEGLKNGLSENQSSVTKMARKVAQAAYDAAKKTLGIKSPSRMFAELGRYTDAGFVKGLASGEKDIYKTATDIMSKTIQNVADTINSGIDAQPIIRPVMDLTNIQNGARNIGTMMDGYAISGSVNLAGITAKSMNYNRIQGEDYTLSAIRKLQDTLTNLLDKPSIEQNINFSITGNNPKEIADEVSRILQQQVERRSATWA